jgi:hypothetical protein
VSGIVAVVDDPAVAWKFVTAGGRVLVFHTSERVNTVVPPVAYEGEVVHGRACGVKVLAVIVAPLITRRSCM